MLGILNVLLQNSYKLTWLLSVNQVYHSHHPYEFDVQFMQVHTSNLAPLYMAMSICS